MTTSRTGFSFARRFIRFATVIAGGAVMPGFVESCDEYIVNVTRYVDPCGTFLANCAPGDFEVNAADVGDYCVDPACTVPGACDDQQPLGTITEICP